MDKERHTNVQFCGLEKASKSVNDPFFLNLDEFDEETFEVDMIYYYSLFLQNIESHEY